jgi:hypothetical protein
VGTPSQGSQYKFYVEPGNAPHTFDTSSERYAIISSTLKKRGKYLDNNEMRGTRSHAKERIRAGTYDVLGDVVMDPSPSDLDLWFPRAMGAAESTDTFALGESLASFAFGVLQVRDFKRHEYTDCKVSKMVLESAEGGHGFLRMTLSIIGKTEVADTTEPSVALSTASNTAPYTHYNCSGGVTLNSAVRDTKSIRITIDNHIEASFNNSVTADELKETDRTIMLEYVGPWTADEINLYDHAEAGFAGSVVYTNGAMSTTFTFANLKAPAETPDVTGKGEISLPQTYIAYKSGSTEPLIITHDSAA